MEPELISADFVGAEEENLRIKQRAIELLTGESCFDDYPCDKSFVDIISLIDTDLGYYYGTVCQWESDEEIERKLTTDFPELVSYKDKLTFAIKESEGKSAIAKVFVMSMISLKLIGLRELDGKTVRPGWTVSMSQPAISGKKVKVEFKISRDDKIVPHETDMFRVIRHGEDETELRVKIGSAKEFSHVFFLEDFNPGYYIIKVLSQGREVTRTKRFFVPAIKGETELTEKPDAISDFSFDGHKRTLYLTLKNASISTEDRVGLFTAWSLKNDRPVGVFRKLKEFPAIVDHTCFDLSSLIDGVPDGLYEIRIFQQYTQGSWIKIEYYHQNPIWIGKPFAAV